MKLFGWFLLNNDEPRRDTDYTDDTDAHGLKLSVKIRQIRVICVLFIIVQHQTFLQPQIGYLSGNLLNLDLLRKKLPHIFDLVYRNPRRSLCPEASPQEAPQVFIFVGIFIFVSFFTSIIHILPQKIGKGGALMDRII